MQSHVLARTATDTVGVSLPLGRGRPRSQEISGEIPATEALRAPSWGSLFGGAGHSAHPEHRGQVCGRLAVHTELSPIVTHNLVRFSELIISLPLPGPSRITLPQPTAIPGSLAQRTGSDQTAQDEQVCGDALETGSSVWGRERDVRSSSLGQREGYRSCWPGSQPQDSWLGCSPASPLCPGPRSPCRVQPRGSLLDAGRLSATLSASLSRGPATSLASLDRPGLRELSVRWAGSGRMDDQGGAVGPLHPRRPAHASVGRREGGVHWGAQEWVSGQAEG